MVLVFCEHCCGWSVRVAARCADCGQALDLSKPDLTRDQLDSIVGQFLKIIGRASIDRKVLPKLGTLVETSGGILFLPHLEQQGFSLTAPEVSEKPWFEQVSQIWNSFRSNQNFLEDSTPSDLTVFEEDSLSEKMLSMPGSFFVQHERIVTFRKKNQYWTLERLHGKTIQMKIQDAKA